MPVKPSPKKQANIPHAEPRKIPKVTAAQTAKTAAFRNACEAAGVEPSKRQARKYLAQRGRWE